MTFHARYKRQRVIGSGTYGKVYKVKCLDDGLEYVMKRVTLAQNSEADKKQAMMEVEVLSSLRHPHIVPYKECYWDEEEMDLCMVMDYCEGGDLYHYVQSRRKQGRKIEEDEAWLFMIQMMFALSYLHAKKILHRDVKSQNIFLSNGKCQLGDFGLAKKLEESFELARTPIGTPFYMAPEIMEGRPYAFKSDVWALGCVMYEVLTGKPAFAAKNFPGVAMKVLRGHYEPISEDYSPELRDVVSKMLCNNVNARPFIFQLIEMPTIMQRAMTYLSHLETEQIQVGLMGTWRGAIPINTKHMTDHLQAIPEGESEGASSQNSTPAATATPADSPGAMEAQRSTTTQLSPLRAASFPELGEANAAGDGVAAQSPDAGASRATTADSSLLAAWRGYAQEISGIHSQQPSLDHSPGAATHDSAPAAAESPQGEQPELVKSPDEGPKTLPSATLNVDDLTLSLGTTPKWSPNVSALADDSQGSAPLPEGSSAGQFTLPAMDSEEHRLDVDAQQGFEDHLDGAFAPKAAASDSELTSAQHALNEEERRTLRNQLEHLVVIAECVRQAGLCENSGDLGDAAASASAGLAMWQAAAGAQEPGMQPSPLSRPSSSVSRTRQGAEADIAEGDNEESDCYSEDFEDEEEVAPYVMRKEWKEQQRRLDVQRQWNIEAAELVADELSNVAIATPNDSGGETDSSVSDDDRDSVEDETVPAGGPGAPVDGSKPPKPPMALPQSSPERKIEQRNQAQKRMANREQKLRQRCVNGLGEAVYARLYNFLKQRAQLYSEDDDVILRVELSEFLDDSQMAYWPLVDELVFYDQSSAEAAPV